MKSKHSCHRCGFRPAAFLSLCVMCAHLGMGIPNPSVDRLTIFSPKDTKTAPSGFLGIANSDVAVNDFGNQSVFKELTDKRTTPLLHVSSSAVTVAIQAL